MRGLSRFIKARPLEREKDKEGLEIGTLDKLSTTVYNVCGQNLYMI